MTGKPPTPVPPSGTNPGTPGPVDQGELLAIEGLLIEMGRSRRSADADFVARMMDRLADEPAGGAAPDEVRGSISSRIRGTVAELSARPSRRVPERRRSSHFGRRRAGGRWLLPGAVAAAAAAVLVVGMFRMNRAVPAAASVTEVDGRAEILRGGSRLAAAEGMRLDVSDRIVTGPAGRVEFAYAGEDTSVEIDADSQLSFPEESGGKHFFLERGSIAVAAARQPAGRPMTVTTPQARAAVFGTRFLLAVEGVETQLKVAEGLVKLTRLSDNRTVDVAAGQYAAAGPGAELVALPLQTASFGRDDYELGPVVFEDSFDNGLGRWELLVGTDLQHLAPAGAEEGEIARLMPARKLRPEFAGILDAAENRGALLLSFNRERAQGRLVCLRSRAPIAEETFAVKVVVVGASSRNYLTTPFPWETVLNEEENQRRQLLPAEHSFRWDYVPAGTSEAGVARMEARSYMRDLKYRPPKVEGLLWTRLVTCADRRLGFAFRDGQVTLLRVEVRRLLKRLPEGGAE